MTLVIYNTLTREKEEFQPLDPAGRRVTIYNCGPTVYGRFHIGNARNFVVMDLVRRYLERWLGYEVVFVQNLTDIDDKIIRRAAEEHRTADEVAQENIAAYLDDVAKLGIAPATRSPRATEYVGPMIDFMKELEARGVAYAAGGSLYFRVRKFAPYGKLSHRNLDELLDGARVEVKEEKEDPLDFVLWKAAKPGEPHWRSPWGEGRPGWHTECAVMTREILGETIDIHSGGSDLMFPHHENELAQREFLSGKTFARTWMHNGFLNIESEKMSKSIGNIKRIDEVLAHFRPEVVRFFLLSAHYRHPLDYSESALEEAASALRRVNEGLETGRRILELAGRAIEAGAAFDRADPATRPLLDRFIEAMNDDFNTPRAEAVLHDIVSEIHEARKREPVDHAYLRGLVLLGEELCAFFGFAPSSSSKAGRPADAAILAIARDVYGEAKAKGLAPVADYFKKALSAGEIEAIENGAGDLGWETFGGPQRKDDLLRLLIEARRLARKQKAFALADAIRARLGSAGIALEDHPQGTIWREVDPIEN